MAIMGMERSYGAGYLTGEAEMFKSRGTGSDRKYIDGEAYAAKIASEKHAPYDDMADENGFITYHGVTFYCDKDNNQLTLGDVSNPANTITVPLEAGGSLVFNRENIGGLSRAITMFSGEDVRRIMTAIAQDAQCARKQNEIEELETKVGTKPEEAE